MRSAPLLDPLPAFVLSTHWSDAGKIALALGPGVPVFVISDDPRGWAYAPDGGALIGRDGVLVARAAEAPLARVAAAALSSGKIGETRFKTLMRNGAPAADFALVPVRGLTRRLPLPYPGAPGG